MRTPLVAFSRADRAAMRALFHARLRDVPAPAIASLYARWCAQLPRWWDRERAGRVLGPRRGFALFRRRGGRIRVGGLLAAAERVTELVDAIAAELGALGCPVLVDAEAWWPLLGLDATGCAPIWSAHGFAPAEVLLLDAPLPTLFAARPVPAGYRLGGWSGASQRGAAELMARNPDPLGERWPLDVRECFELLAGGRGITAWRAGELAGFVRMTREGAIALLYVAQGHRGAGLGGALLDAALTHFAQAGGVRARVAMAAGNAAAAPLYASRGFRDTGRYTCWIFPRS